MTSSVSQAQTGVNSLASGGSPIGCGSDWHESGLESIYQAAIGEGL